MAETKPEVTKPVRASRTKTTDPGAPAPARKPRASKKTEPVAVLGDGKTTVTPEERYRMIAENAYHRAEKRGFVGGDPLNDWLLAELEVDRQLKAV